MKKVMKIMAVFVIIAALGVASYFAFIKKETKELTEEIKAQENTQEKKQSTLPVSVMKVVRGKIARRAKISAIAEVWEKSTIKSETRGKIQKIQVKVGDYVRKGQVLVKLDDQEKRLDLSKKEALKLQAYSKYLIKESASSIELPKSSEEELKNLENIKKNFVKAQSDYKNGKITSKSYYKIKAVYDEALILSGNLREEILKSTENLSQANVDVEMAQLELERTTIRSPFEGEITELLVSRGEQIQSGVDLLKMVNLNSLYLKGSALESEISSMSKGLAVRAKFDSFPDKYVWGKISAISTEVSVENKTIPIFISLDNSKKKFYPGMNAEIDIEYNVKENVIKVPRDAVQNREGRYLVFVVQDKIAIWKYVTLGIKNDDEQEVLTGLEENDMVIVEGHLTLAHQSRVKVEKVIE